MNPNKADYVFKNGAIYTVNPNRDWAEALAIAGDQIIYVGPDSGVETFIDSGTTVIDLDQKMVLPGFIDAHAHPSQSMSVFVSINLHPYDNQDDYLEAIANFVKENPNEAAYQGGGWSNEYFPPTGPQKEVLDAICPDRPISLISSDGHSLWVNSKALEMAQITKDMPNPVGGVIEKHPETGELTGTLRETPMKLVDAVLPPYSLEQRKRTLLAYQEMSAKAGMTGSHDSMLDADCIQSYKALEAEGLLKMRFRGAITLWPDSWETQVDMFKEERETNSHPFFQTNTAKVFVDGVVEGSTAYLFEPYEHMPGFRGEPLWSEDQLKEVTAAMDKEGFQIHVHVIGDAAAKMTLDAFEYARDKNGQRDSRHLITHIQLIETEDIHRFKELDIIGVVQPFWFKIDEYFWNLSIPYLGEERAHRNYPMQSLIDAGVTLASSSDFFVTVPCDPLIAIETGITRMEIGGGTEAPLWPEECASLEDLIASFTINGAFANFMDKETGSLEVGKQADVIILDQNLFEIPSQKIAQAKVLFTLVDGVEVFRDSSLLIQ